MLSEARYTKILSILKESQSVTVKELAEILNTSESTIRRDLNVLHQRRKLEKVFGGAVLSSSTYINTEDNIEVKMGVRTEEKKLIASYAATLIEDGDCVYIDAGSTTGMMLDHIQAHNVIFVTNSPGHNRTLSAKGFTCILTGGELRVLTDALVGPYAKDQLTKFNFNKGFFGTNAISRDYGYTTSDHIEAAIKSDAMARCHKAYVLADTSKFGSVAALTFADIGSAIIITSRLDDKRYLEFTEVLQVEDRA